MEKKEIEERLIKIQVHISEAFHMMGKLIHDILEEKKEKKDNERNI